MEHCTYNMVAVIVWWGSFIKEQTAPLYGPKTRPKAWKNVAQIPNEYSASSPFVTKVSSSMLMQVAGKVLKSLLFKRLNISKLRKHHNTYKCTNYLAIIVSFWISFIVHFLSLFTIKFIKIFFSFSFIKQLNHILCNFAVISQLHFQFTIWGYFWSP